MTLTLTSVSCYYILANSSTYTLITWLPPSYLLLTSTYTLVAWSPWPCLSTPPTSTCTLIYILSLPYLANAFNPAHCLANPISLPNYYHSLVPLLEYWHLPPKPLFLPIWPTLPSPLFTVITLNPPLSISILPHLTICPLSMFSLHIAINNPLFTSRLIYTLTQLFINNPVDIPIFSTYFPPLGFCQYDPVEISYLLLIRFLLTC